MADTLSLSPEQFKSMTTGGGSLSPNSPNFSWQIPQSVQAQRDVQARAIQSDPRDATSGNLPTVLRDSWNASEISSELANPNLTKANQQILLNERSKLGNTESRGVQPTTLSLSPEQFRSAFGGSGTSSNSGPISLSPEDFKKAFASPSVKPTGEEYVQGRDANPFEAAATALVDIKGQNKGKAYLQSMIAPVEVIASLTASIPEFILGAVGGAGAAAGALASGKLPTQKDIEEGMAGGAPQWAKDFAHFARPRTAAGRLLNAPVEAALDLALQAGGRVASLPAAQWATIKEAMDNGWSLNRLVQTFKKTSDDITPLTTALVGLGLAGKMGRDTQIFLEKKVEQRAEKRLEDLEKQTRQQQDQRMREGLDRGENLPLPFEEPLKTRQQILMEQNLENLRQMRDEAPRRQGNAEERAFRQRQGELDLGEPAPPLRPFTAEEASARQAAPSIRNAHDVWGGEPSRGVLPELEGTARTLSETPESIPYGRTPLPDPRTRRELELAGIPFEDLKPSDLNPRGVRDRAEPVDTEQSRFPARAAQVGEMTPRQGAPFEQRGLRPEEPARPISEQLPLTEQRGPAPSEGIPYDTSRPISDFGTVGEARAQALEKVAAERVQQGLNRDGIPIEGSQMPLAFTAMGRRQGGFIGFRRDAAKQGVARTLADRARENVFDTRPLLEIATEYAGKNFPDMMKKGYYNFFLPSQIGRLSRNPVFGAVVQRAMKIDRWKDNTFRDILTGTGITKSRGGRESRSPSPDGALTIYREMYRAGRKIREELEGWKATAQKLIGVRDQVASDFKTTRQWQVQQAIANGNKKLLKIVNEERALFGKEPIKTLPGYLPAIREGDFMIRAFDKEGRKIHAEAVNHPWAARKVRSEWLKMAGEGGKVRIEKLQPGKYGNRMDYLSAILEASTELSRQGRSELAKQMESAAAEIIKKRAAGGHGLHRSENLGGWLGQKEGKKGLQDFERAYESYTHLMLEYAANLKKTRIAEEIARIPKEVKDKMENTLDAAAEYLEKSRGADMSQAGIIDKPVNTIVSDVIGKIVDPTFGLGAGTTKRTIAKMNGMLVPFLLYTMRNAIQNGVQHLLVLPRLSRLEVTGDLKPGIQMQRYLSGLAEHLSRTPDAKTVEAYNWAQREGFFDPTISQFLDFKWGDTPTTNSRLLKERAKLPWAMIEKHFVRALNFTIIEKALRETIKDDKTRWEKAAFEADDISTNYSPNNLPIVYDKLGVMGDLTKGLKQFSHGQFGAMLDYVKLAKEGLAEGNLKAMEPALWATSVSIALAGLQGMMGIKEADAIISALNTMLGTDWKTASQWMLEEPNLPDALVKGGMSAALGVDISQSVAQPNLPSMAGAPALEVTGTAVVQSVNYLIKRLKGSATEADEMKMALALTPAAGRGLVENIYSDKNGFVVNPNKKMEPIYQRSPEERIVSAVTGMRSSRRVEESWSLESHAKSIAKSFTGTGKEKFENFGEAQARELIRTVRELQALDQKQRNGALDAIIDRLKQGKEIPPDLIQKYVENGGQRQSLNTAINRRMRELEMTYLEKQLKGKMNQNKLERIDPLMNVPLRSKEMEREKRSEVERDRSIIPAGVRDEPPRPKKQEVPRPTMKWEDIRGRTDIDTMPMIVPGDMRNRIPARDLMRERYRGRRPLEI